MKNLLSKALTGCICLLAFGTGRVLMAQTSSFTGADLGTPTHAGSATVNGDGTITVKGGGADLWNNADSGFYYYTSVTGKVWDARMRIISFDGPDTWSKVELMARRPDPVAGTPAAGDPQIDICSTRVAGVNDIEYQYRGTRDGGSGNQAAGGLTPNYPNEWVRITRFNSLFRLYFSKDGTTWTLINSQDTATTANGFNGVAWEDPTLIGVAVTAHNDTTTNLGIAVISNLTVNVTPVTAPTVAGVQTPINGTTNVYAFAEASFNFVATNNATPAGVYGMNYAWYKNNTLVSTNRMGPNYTFLTTSADDGAQIYCIASVADTNYSSITVTSGVLTLTTKPGALVYTNGLKREFFTNATRQDVEIGSVGRAASVSLTSKADMGNDGANYTERLSGYFIPPADGAYVFFVNSDDDSDLYLSTDDTPAHKQLIAQEKDWSNPYQWLAVGGTGNNNDPSNKRSDQFSPDGGITIPNANGINLTGGQLYYIEAVHHQGGGGGNLAVTYQTTNQIADPNWAINFTNGVLPLLDATNHNIAVVTWAGTNLQWVVQPPASVNAFEGQSASFSAMAVSDAEMVPSYQWYISTNGTLPGVAYAGATSTNLTLGTIPANYNGAKFYAVASTYEGGLSITSSVVTLTVQQAVFEPGFVKDERWSGQNSLGNLEAGALGDPNYTMVVPGWSVTAGNPNTENNIVRRVSGYFVPPTSGNYVFFVTSDDDSDLFVSTDNTPAHKRMVCQQGGWNSGGLQWLTGNGGGTASQTRSDQWIPTGGGSAPYSSGIAMNAGQKYYIEQDYHQGGGGANLAVTYKLVGDPDPVAGNDTRLKGNVIGMSAVRSTNVTFTAEPADVTAPPMGYATFSADGTTDSKIPIGDNFALEQNVQSNYLFFQWYTNGVAVPGASGKSLTLGPLLPSQDGMQVYCKMRSLGYADASLNPIWTNSTTATLTISPQAVFEPGYAWVDWWSNTTSRAQVENGSAGAPSFSFAAPKFESPTDGATAQYVNRVSAFFMPPTNGNYVFFVNADDTADLFLNTNGPSPSGRTIIAQETSWSGSWGWLSGNGSTSQKRSDSWSPDGGLTTPYLLGIPLNAGQKYWLEGVHSDTGGGNNFEATVRDYNDFSGYPADGDDTRLAGDLIGIYVPRIPWVQFLEQPADQTVMSGGNPVTFAVQGTNPPSIWLGTTTNPYNWLTNPPTTSLQYQWYKNGNPIPGANSSSYTQPYVLPSDQNAQFYCAMRALGYADDSLNPIWTNSQAAVLNVITDSVPPTLTYAATFVNTNFDPGLIVLDITFDKWMDGSTLSNAANYSIAGVTITNISVASNHRTVELALSSMPTLPLTVNVSGVKDLSGNTIAGNSSVAVNPVPLNFTDVGFPPYQSANFGVSGYDPTYPSLIWVAGSRSYVVSAEGSDIWNAADGFNFGWELKTNDFDVAVRVVKNGHSSNYAKAGLMVRETLAAGSRNWNIVNDPASSDGIMAPDNSGFGANRVEANMRETADAASVGWDNLIASTTTVPAYPNAWVRLKRTGNVLDGYYSTNGVTWLHMASYDTSTNASGPLTNIVHVGICTTAHNNDIVTTYPPPPPEFYNTAEYADYNSSYVAVVVPRLTVGRSGNNVTVSWSPAGGHLEASPALGGPNVNWQSVGTSNPATIPIGSGNQYFRVVTP